MSRLSLVTSEMKAMTILTKSNNETNNDKRAILEAFLLDVQVKRYYKRWSVMPFNDEDASKTQNIQD